MPDVPKSSPASRPQAFGNACLIAGVYLVAAVLWIYFSDRIVATFQLDAEHLRWVQTVKGFAFVTLSGLLLFWVTYSRLLTIYRTKDRLHETSRQYADLLGNLPGMAFRCDSSDRWNMQFVSDGCRDLTGYSPDDLRTGRVNFQSIIHPEDYDSVRRQISRAVNIHARFCLEFRINTAGGETRWVWASGNGTFENIDQLTGIEGFIIDISERKQASRLTAERKTLVKQAQASDRTLSIVAHELRSPLANLVAIADLLSTDGAPGEADHRKLLEGISQQSRRMSQMVDDMLESCRLKSGRTNWDWTAVPVREICADALEMVRPLVDASKVSLDLSVEPDGITMLGDSDALRRVLVNLLSNATRFTAAGSIGITVQGEEDPDHRPHVRIRVHDTGSGIPPEIADGLGVPFALNMGGKKHARRGGTGLGLAICRQIVAAHAGHISVQSRLGQGTQFDLLFPCDLAEPRSSDEPAPIHFEFAAA